MCWSLPIRLLQFEPVIWEEKVADFWVFMDYYFTSPVVGCFLSCLNPVTMFLILCEIKITSCLFGGSGKVGNGLV